MIRDPIPVLQAVLGAYLRSTFNSKIEIDGSINSKVPWRPHILERPQPRGWYIHAGPTMSDSWAQRIVRARDKFAKLRIGVAGPKDLFENEQFLDVCHSLNAAVLIFNAQANSFSAGQFFNSVDDLIYSRRLKLTPSCACEILDRSLGRAMSETDKIKKGVLLEVLLGVLLSQVDGFEVTSVNISNRTQQMDVLVHNRIVGGSLGGSPIVLAEAKNWKNPVGTPEYSHFLRKLESRHGRAKLGFLVTTGRFTSGVAEEIRRESKGEILVVPVDGKVLASLWRDHTNITAGFEKITVEATVGV